MYEAYQDEIKAWQDRYAQLLRDFVESFATMTDTAAISIIEDYYSIETGRLEVRHDYVPKFLGVIPARKLVLLYQMENKIDAVAELPLVLEVPLLEAPAATTTR